MNTPLPVVAVGIYGVLLTSVFVAVATAPAPSPADWAAEPASVTIG